MGNRGLTLLVIVLLSVSSMALVLDSDGPGTTVQDNIAEENFEDLPSNLEPNILVPRVSGAFLENKGQLENELILYYAAGDPMSVGFGTGLVQYVQREADTAQGNVVTITFPGAVFNHLAELCKRNTVSNLDTHDQTPRIFSGGDCV